MNTPCRIVPTTCHNHDAALMQLDEQCLQQWRYRNKLLADDATLRSCALN